jgi:hypothetical protein
MPKRIILAAFILAPVLLFSQEKPAENKSEKKAEDRSPKTVMDSVVVPAQSQYSDRFIIRNIYFNKRVDLAGKGDILEIEMVLENLTDDPMDFYIHAIASFEKVEKTRSSFERPVPEKERIRSFVPYPEGVENFQYPVKDRDGNTKKDYFGKEMIELKKLPHDSKKGVDPSTGKMYHLEKKLVVRTYHLSLYRNNYFFFNEAVILMFDAEGKPVFRQQYALNGWRR